MLRNTVQNIIRFVALVLVQVLVLNHVQFLGFINPYIYILFILSQPAKQATWLSLLLAFAMGLVIDVFSNTPGMHAFALVFVAFARKGIIKLFITIDDNFNPLPSFRTFGASAYIKYIVVTVFIHHILLFFLESFSFSYFWIVLLKTILSSIVTIILILGIRLTEKK
jgi:rod shape-determining protein MreD